MPYSQTTSFGWQRHGETKEDMESIAFEWECSMCQSCKQDPGEFARPLVNHPWESKEDIIEICHDEFMKGSDQTGYCIIPQNGSEAAYDMQGGDTSNSQFILACSQSETRKQLH